MKFLSLDNIIDIYSKPELEPFDPKKCKCNEPPYMPPCRYCESGEYIA